jgi:hypothetical protein
VIETRLREFAPDAEIHFELVAVTKEQIEEFRADRGIQLPDAPHEEVRLPQQNIRR